MCCVSRSTVGVHSRRRSVWFHDGLSTSLGRCSVHQAIVRPLSSHLAHHDSFNDAYSISFLPHYRLKAKGIDVSGSGVSVTGKKRFNYEDELDATQRKFIKAVGASSFKKANEAERLSAHGPQLRRQESTGASSVHSLTDSTDSESNGIKSYFRRNK